MLRLSARRPIALLAVPLLTVFPGCFGTSSPYSYVKESGSVKYDDGSPIPADQIRLTFVPQDAKAANEKQAVPPGFASVTTPDGKFDQITSRKSGDGLVPGKAKVTVVGIDKNEREIPDIIPPEYHDPKTTPLEVDTAQPDSFNLKVKKPTGKAAPKKG